MRQCFKNYKMTIRAVSPIFIGSGEEIGKKEYIYMPWNHRVIIPDIYTMYDDLRKRGLSDEYEKFMIDSRNNQMSLSNWLAQKQFRQQDYERWAKYKLDAGEAFQDRNSRPKGISAFVKDAYGMPYVPGSSIKGMIRTALLIKEITEKPEKYRMNREQFKRGSGEKMGRNNYLKHEITELEKDTFYCLQRDDKKSNNAVNDCMAGISVGDSYPVSAECLTLSQKIDVTLEGKRKSLPILRETLVPGTEIHFDLKIDSSLCAYTIEDIMDAMLVFRDLSNQYFYSRFRRNIEEENAVFLGGGCGYVSKTVMYAMFGKDAVWLIDRIFQATLGRNYSDHKHGRDIDLQIAPHVCKCTVYQGKLYDMGIGQIFYEQV